MKKPILEVVHESVEGLFDLGLVDTKTMHSFDAMCLPPVKKFTPKQIKQIRLREKVSQPVLLNI